MSSDGLRELIAPVLADAGLELWDVEQSRDVVRILVERPGGIDLDGLTAASGVLSPLLDDHPELVPSARYQLEVSSPGLERTLRTPDQYRRYLGSTVSVKTTVPVGGARRHRGRLQSAGDTSVVLELEAPDPSGETSIELRYDQIDRTRTVLVWGPTSGRPRSGNQPGSGSRSPKPAAATGAPSFHESRTPDR
jgi:ribosome maturation factor RimP